jgi:hypothetical protein
MKFMAVTDFSAAVHLCLALARITWVQGAFASVAKKGVG